MGPQAPATGVAFLHRPGRIQALIVNYHLVCASKIVLYCNVRNNWDLGHSERTMNAKKIAVVSLLVAVVALAACRREECCKPMKLGAGDVATTEVAR